ncbi:sulfite exporter TauE/SafE family protein [Pseudomonas putida]|uniref:sulfite exporter TauE/SafE family protein n=1 Tax=Pseudomonas putida TaxID=303 RepID=UPI000382C28A|nr:sulfite exporter TauE/SafE family protein [Pseudomonas putida]
MFLDLMYGVGVGLALGMTGGGGVLAVPALVLGLGYSLPQAKPVALIAVGGSAFLGCIDGFRRGLVRYKAAAVMAILGILCAPIGLWVGRVLSTTTLMLVFCFVLIAISAKMFLQATYSDESNQAEMASQLNCRLNPETGRFKWTGRCFASFSAIGGFSGLLSGMLGLGGGFIIVPGVRHLSDLNMHGTVATALAVISFISAGTVTSFLLAGGIIEPQAWRFIAAAGVGMLIGRQLAPKVAGNILQIGFSLLVCIAAVMLFVRTVLSL